MPLLSKIEAVLKKGVGSGLKPGDILYTTEEAKNRFGEGTVRIVAVNRAPNSRLKSVETVEVYSDLWGKRKEQTIMARTPVAGVKTTEQQDIEYEDMMRREKWYCYDPIVGGKYGQHSRPLPGFQDLVDE